LAINKTEVCNVSREQVVNWHSSWHNTYSALISNSGNDDRFKSQMFESGNQLRFERPGLRDEHTFGPGRNGGPDHQKRAGGRSRPSTISSTAPRRPFRCALAEQIGRYAWIKMGFLPTADAWMQMKREALLFILDHDRHLGGLANELLRRVHGGGPGYCANAGLD
jgi:hypothetical protein